MQKTDIHRIKKHWKRWAMVVAAVLIISIIDIANRSGSQDKALDLVTVTKHDIVELVSLTGRVRSVHEMDLAFEQSGKVEQSFVSVGDMVKAGTVLVTLTSSDLQAQLAQAQSLWAGEKAKLLELQLGARPEEIAVDQTNLSNADIALSDARANVERVSAKASADLETALSGGLSEGTKAATVGKNALLTISQIQGDHFTYKDQDNTAVAEAKGRAVFALFGVENADWWQPESIGMLSGGLYRTLAAPNMAFSQDGTMGLLVQTKSALELTAIALDAVNIKDVLSTTEKSDLASEKVSVSTALANVSNKLQAIAGQKAANDSFIQNAAEKLNQSQSAYNAAEKELLLKRAPATTEQLTIQGAQVQNAAGKIAELNARLQKTRLYSPIDGVVTRNDAKIGEIVSANEVVVSIIANQDLEIVANVPEADIARVAVGNTAHLTLDAFGFDESFEATVVRIHPAETIIEGVPTYETIFQLATTDDRVKSGMTANLDIKTAEKKDILAIPQRAIVSKDGQKVVRVWGGTGTKTSVTAEVQVTTGLKGQDGYIEIVSGLNEGDQVVIDEGGRSM